MGFCTQCGTRLIEGETHVCEASRELSNAAAEVSAAGGTALSRGTGLNVDPAILLKLLRKPESSASLRPERDIIYGILGLIVSVFGFWLWTFLLQKQVFESVDSLFGGFGLFGGFDFDIVESSRLLMVGLGSILSFIASLWLLGNWKGSKKYNLKEVVTYLGSIQLFSGGVFLLAAGLVFLSIKLSLLLALINLLTVFLLTVMLAHDLYRITVEQRFFMVSSTIVLYVVLLFIVLALVI